MTRAPFLTSPATGHRSLAQLITYLLEPKNWLIVTVPLIGAHADGLAGVGWGLLAAFFVVIGNLVVDILYTYLDPRVRIR